MELESLQKRSKIEEPKALKQFQKFEKLLDSLSQKNIPTSVLDNINQQVDNLNLIQVDPKTYHKELRKTYNDILKLLKKELKFVPKHYYRNMWLAVGMSSFGIPIGVAFGLALDNMGFIGIGLPIGMGIGIAIGAGMDNKAKEEGKQLDIEI